MIYGSICSGIEAASAAWHPLGWRAAFLSEIEPFPRAVLRHHYPDVPLHGDFTTIREGDYAAIDLLVGGTPCQSFSVAGLRKGLDDDRGNLALEYLRLADRLRPRWLVWENVPGVLSSNGGRDFGSILGGMVELGYGFAYRVLDAQYVRVDGFGRAVPQRRRRVFVVGCLGDWRRAAAVLFERESMSGNPAPRREAGQGIALTISSRPTGGGGLGADFDLDGGLIANSGDVSFCVSVSVNGQRSNDAETETLVACSSSGDGYWRNGIGPLRAREQESHEHLVAHALRGEGFDASEDGTGRGTPIVPVAYRTAGDGAVYEEGDKTAPLTTATDPNANIIAIQERAISENPDAGPDGAGVRADGAAYTLEARTTSQAVAFDLAQITSKANRSALHPVAPTMMKDSQLHAVAFDLRGRDGGAVPEGPHDTANIRAASGGSSRSYIAEQWAVRRLTPMECERLQGFSDEFTRIPWRGKEAESCPDGPRYKALGNSMAVNVMRWIGRRIEMADSIETAA